MTHKELEGLKIGNTVYRVVYTKGIAGLKGVKLLEAKVIDKWHGGCAIECDDTKAHINKRNCRYYYLNPKTATNTAWDYQWRVRYNSERMLDEIRKIEKIMGLAE